MGIIINIKGEKGIIMATKSKKRTVKKAAHKTVAPAKRKFASECTPRECVRENRELKIHLAVITVLSVMVCVLVAALVIVVLKG